MYDFYDKQISFFRGLARRRRENQRIRRQANEIVGSLLKNKLEERKADKRIKGWGQKPSLNIGGTA